jgi:hypothetical protein
MPDKVDLTESEKGWVTVGKFARVQVSGIPVSRGTANLVARTGSGDNSHVRRRVLLQVLRGTADANIRFEELRSLLGALGFEERIKGITIIYARSGIAEIVNLQPRGSMAKPYQVKQVRALIVKYKPAERVE